MSLLQVQYPQMPEECLEAIFDANGNIQKTSVAHWAYIRIFNNYYDQGVIKAKLSEVYLLKDSRDNFFRWAEECLDLIVGQFVKGDKFELSEWI